MKHLAILSVFTIALLMSCQSNQVRIGQNDFAIQKVNIVDVKTGELHENRTVIISGNKIKTIIQTDSISLSGIGKLVDGSGKYLIPGLWDMHAHLFNESDIRNAGYPLFIANGITGIRIMAADCLNPPCGDPDMTIAQYRILQKEIKEGKLLGPKTILASDYINGTLKGESTVLKPKTEEHGRQLARLLKDRDVDFIKIYDVLTSEAYFGLTDEAKRLNLEFAGHVPLTISPSIASDAGQKSIEHTEIPLFMECSDIEDEEVRARVIHLFTNQQGELGYWNAKNVNELMYELVKSFNSQKCHELYEKFIRNNTWFVPTLQHLEIYFDGAEDWKLDPRMKYMPKEEYDFFKDEYEPVMREFRSPFIPEVEEMRKRLVFEMQRAGVGILAGSDVGEVGLVCGFSLHDEILSLQNAGLTPLQALQSATINPAKYQNTTDTIGSIEKGKIADLVLLNKNPLEDIKNTQEIEAVFTNGRYFSRKDLDSLLLSVENYIKNEN